MGPVQSLCGQNLLNKLYQQYGDNVMKFILAQKSKFIINDKFTQLTRMFHQAFQQTQSTVQKMTDTKTHQLTTTFEGLKNKANSLLPGGIAVLQRLKGQSINEFSGFNSLLTQIQSLKSQSFKNLNLKKQEMISQIEVQKQKMLQNITQTQPSIPLYDQLPEPLKKTLFSEVESKFGEQMKKNESELNEKIMDLFDASALYRMFQEMSPARLIEKLISDGLSQMERNIFSNIPGASIGSVAGNFGSLTGNLGSLTGSLGENTGNGVFSNVMGNVLR